MGPLLGESLERSGLERSGWALMSGVGRASRSLANCLVRSGLGRLPGHEAPRPIGEAFELGPPAGGPSSKASPMGLGASCPGSRPTPDISAQPDRSSPDLSRLFALERESRAARL